MVELGQVEHSDVHAQDMLPVNVCCLFSYLMDI